MTFMSFMHFHLLLLLVKESRGCSFARLRSLLQIMPGYQGNKRQYGDKGDFSRTKRSPVRISIFLLFNKVEAYHKTETTDDIQTLSETSLRYLTVVLCLNLQGNVQRSFGECLGLQLASSL